jgi:16S rRNA (cytosine1402-N4)-methyltransferase
MLGEVLAALDPQPGMTLVDCTCGWAGHSAELLKRVGPHGLLVAFDMDAENLPKARERLDAVGHPYHLHHANFAAIGQVLAEHNIAKVDGLLADLGMSSMQVDDPARGFSYSRDGALDMRMDRSRGKTAAQLLATIGERELVQMLHELGDEPEPQKVARAIIEARDASEVTTTRQLAGIIQEATNQENWRLHPAPGKWNIHPAARTFQALRIAVNRELANLEHLLRVAPGLLKSGGTAAIISFHSGEDRLVKAAFKAGLERGQFSSVAEEPIRAGFLERTANPRSRSAKLRWAKIAS